VPRIEAQLRMLCASSGTSQAVSDADLAVLLSVDAGAWQDEADHTRGVLHDVRRPPAGRAVGRARRPGRAPERRQLTSPSPRRAEGQRGR
jgi:hypothetical protein